MACSILKSESNGLTGATRIKIEIYELAVSLLLIALPALLCLAPGFPRSIVLATVVGLLSMASLILLALGQFEYWIGLLLGVLCFFPAEAVGILSGYYYGASSGLVNMSLAGYMAIIMFSQRLVFAANLKFELDERLLLSAVLFSFILIVTRIVGDGFSGLLSNKLFDNYLIPFLSFFAISGLPFIDRKKVLYILLAFLVVDACFACVEFALSSNILFHDYFMGNNIWYQNIVASHQYGVAYRSCSCIGHPLTVALFMNLGFVLASRIIDRPIARYCIYLLFLVAILTTNSRSGLIVFTVFLIYFAYKRGPAYLALCILLVVAGLGLLFWQGGLYEALFSRDKDGGSLLQRAVGFGAILSSSSARILIGTGFSGSQNLVRSFSGSAANMEVGPLIVFSEIGVFAFIAYTLFFINCLRYMRAYDSAGSKYDSLSSTILLMLLCFIIECCTYNSIGDTGQIMYMSMALLGILCAPVKNEES